MSAHLRDEEVELAASGQTAGEHLAGCAQCRQAVAQARGRQRLLKAVTPYTLSDAGFSRVEAAVLERMREPAPSRWSAWLPRLWPAVALAAAMALAFVAWPRVQPAERTVVPEPVAFFEPMRAVLVQGQVSLGGGAPLEVGAELKALAVLDASRGRVVLASALAQLEVQGTVSLGQPRASVALASGSVLLAVSGAPRWVVGAGAYWVGANDAEFAVSRVGADEVLEVQRGSVHYGEWADREGRVVSAPARVSLSPGGTAAARASRYPATSLKLPRQGALVSLDDLPTGAGVELDGQAYGGAPLSLLLPEGKHHLKVSLADGSLRERDFELRSGQTATLTLPEPAVHAPAPRPERQGGVVDSVVDTEALRRWVAEQKPKLVPCYEKWLKATPDARGQATLTISVSAAGRVGGSRVEPAGALPAAVAECLVRTASKWRPPVRDTDIEIPLVLGAH